MNKMIDLIAGARPNFEDSINNQSDRRKESSGIMFHLQIDPYGTAL